MVATIDDQDMVLAKADDLSPTAPTCELNNGGGQWAWFKDVKVWKAELDDKWPQKRATSSSSLKKKPATLGLQVASALQLRPSGVRVSAAQRPLLRARARSALPRPPPRASPIALPRQRDALVVSRIVLSRGRQSAAPRPAAQRLVPAAQLDGRGALQQSGQVVVASPVGLPLQRSPPTSPPQQPRRGWDGSTFRRMQAFQSWSWRPSSSRRGPEPLQRRPAPPGSGAASSYASSACAVLPQQLAAAARCPASPPGSAPPGQRRARRELVERLPRQQASPSASPTDPPAAAPPPPACDRRPRSACSTRWRSPCLWDCEQDQERSPPQGSTADRIATAIQAGFSPAARTRAAPSRSRARPRTRPSTA